MVTALLLAGLLSQSPTLGPARPRNVQDHFFSFLTSSIVLANECTGADLVSDQGGAITFSRPSLKYCTKSDGTMVLLTSDKPAVDADGLSTEGDSLNLITTYDDIDTGSSSTYAGTIVPTENNCVTPTGTTTGDTLNATTNGAAWQWGSSTSFSGTNAAVSVYAKVTSGTQAFRLVLRDSDADAVRCTADATLTTSWQRVSCSAVGTIVVGNQHQALLYPAGPSAQGAACVWGMQLEQQSYATSLIRTTGTFGERAAESISITPAHSVSGAGCFAATVTAPACTWAISAVFANFSSGGYIYADSATSVNVYDSTNIANVNPGITCAPGATFPLLATWGGSTQNLTANAVHSSSPFDGVMGGSTVYFGSLGGTFAFANSHLKNVKLGATSAGCLR